MNGDELAVVLGQVLQKVLHPCANIVQLRRRKRRLPLPGFADADSEIAQSVQDAFRRLDYSNLDIDERDDTRQFHQPPGTVPGCAARRRVAGRIAHG